jgi:hypothetical protein
MTWRKSNGHEVSFHARASDGKGNTIYFNLETAALVRTFYYGGDNYLWHSVDHNLSNSAHEESDTWDFVAEEAFLTADGHQALVVHTRHLQFGTTDHFEFHIDGSTVGFPQPADTWMKAKVKIHTTLLSDGMSLDEAKTIVNGLKFMGGTPTPAIRDSPEYANMSPGSGVSESTPTTNPTVMPAAQGSAEGNAFLFIKQEGIQGMEAEITLPAAGNSLGAGVFIDMFDSSPLGSSGIELVNRASTGTHFSYDYFDSTGNELDGYMNANVGTTYRVAVLHSGGKTTFYVDGEKIQEFDQPFTPDYWGVGAFNDNGQPFTAYVDNVRVLTTATGDGQLPYPVASGDKWSLYDYSQSKWIPSGDILRERLVALLKDSPNPSDTIRRVQAYGGSLGLSQDSITAIVVELSYFSNSTVLQEYGVTLPY